ncbi:MAG: hypothetical protein K2I90_11420 [Odoribacter sp.]|nr:hypothetical protein [Odoribacter sp.]
MPGRKDAAGPKDGSGVLAHSWGYVFWQIARPMLYRWLGEMGWQVFKSMFSKKR